jgi:ATP-dependent RNA helicase DeaD
VRRLHASLTERGFDAVALSGEHSQNERNHALQALRDQRARVCVATDVAARGIDLPSVSLVIHVELPRDAEALQHRSGRTGRAGRKGTAILIVPFQRRKRVEGMLRGARINVEWIGVPAAAEIRVRDRERLMTTLSAPVELEEDDQELARQLMAELSPEAIAAALVKSLRTDMPAPEDIIPSSQRAERDAGPRPGFEGARWFKLNAGRRHNADPRWLLPLICRYGHVGRAEVGAIRIAANESYFQISERAVQSFQQALRRATIAPEDEGLMIELAEPREAPREGPRGKAPRDKPSSYRPEQAHEKPRVKKKPRRPKPA